MEKWLVRHVDSERIDMFFPKQEVKGGFIGDLLTDRNDIDDYYLELNKWVILEKNK